jgi:transposase
MTEKSLAVYDLLLKVENEGLSQMKASELLGISDRHFRRLLKSYREQGAKALASKQAGRPSNNRIKPAVKAQVVELLKTRYVECGPTFAYYKFKRVEGVTLSKESIRKIMIEEGLWEPRKRKRIKLYQKRTRRSAKGELVQIDGSPHAWLEDRGPKCCLLASIDDATSNLQHLKFVQAETTRDYLLFLKEEMEKHGKPFAYYTDRLNVFRINYYKESYRGKGLTQVGRALKELGVELICANSPQAKGRIERVFKTLQDRLVKELRLRKINSLDQANRYLEEYRKEHNALFSVEAFEKSAAYRRVATQDLEKALCFKEERKLTKNLELSYEGRILQIETKERSYRLQRAKVLVIEDVQGKLKIEHDGEELFYKELWVKDHQGKVKNRKEVIADGVFPLGGRKECC